MVFGVGNTGFGIPSLQMTATTEEERTTQLIAAGLRPDALSHRQRVPVAIVGEAPGANEDLQGEPFVGRAGNLLNKMIAGMRFERADFFITNAVLCRPPNNRTPEKDELDACSTFLEGQLLNVNPKVILCMGATAARALINTNSPVGQLRNRWWTWREYPVRVTYHPAAVLRDDTLKKPTWADLVEVVNFINAAKDSV